MNGYSMPVGSDLCLNFCATGYYPDETEPICLGLGAKFNIDFTQHQSNSIWSSTVNDDVTWTVSVFGGLSELTAKRDDPIEIEHRGLYFDGIYKLATVRGLTLHHTFAVGFWAKPHSDGTLFSSSKIYDSGVEKSIHFGIVNKDLEFEDKNHYFYKSTSRRSVLYNTW